MSRNIFQIALRARSFHSSASLKKVDVAAALIPQSLKERFLSKRNSGLLIIPQDQLKKRSAEFWEFLLSEAKSNPEAASLQSAIEEFRKGAVDKKSPQVLLLKGAMPRVDAKSVKRFIDDYSISSSTSATSKEEEMRMTKEQELNLDFLQIIFDLCGLKIFDRGIGSYPAVIIVTKTETQQYHCDGHPKEILSKDGEVELISKIAVNALFAVEVDPKLRVLTSFIKIDDIIKKLSPETLRILQEPIFIGLASKIPAYYPKPHPILQNNNEVWNLLYPDGAVDVFANDFRNLTKEEREKIIAGREALGEFRKVIDEMEKENIFSTELGVDRDKNPDAIVIFHDGRVVHRRLTEVKSLFENLASPAGFLKGLFASRVAISVAGQDNPSATIL